MENMAIDYNEQMLNYYPEVIKSIREFQELVATQSLQVEEMHEELTKILQNNYFEDVEIVRGKNLLDLKSLQPRVYSYDKKFVILNGGVRVTPTGSGYQYLYLRWLPISQLDGQTLTLSVTMNYGAQSIMVRYCDALCEIQRDVAWINRSNRSVSFTIDSSSEEAANCEYVYFVFCSYFNEYEYADFTNIQIELGLSATEYEPYWEHSEQEPNIERWERVLGITPLPQGEDAFETWLTDRQDTVLARLYSSPKLNTKSISDIVEIFTGGTANSYFSPETSTITVIITPPKNNKQYKFENVEQELRKKIPAHLTFRVDRNYYTWLETNATYKTWGDLRNVGTWEDILTSIPNIT